MKTIATILMVISLCLPVFAQEEATEIAEPTELAEPAVIVMPFQWYD
jgi:hypothetical protein